MVMGTVNPITTEATEATILIDGMLQAGVGNLITFQDAIIMTPSIGVGKFLHTQLQL